MKKSENDRNNGSMCKQSNVTHPGLISGTRPRYHVSGTIALKLNSGIFHCKNYSENKRNIGRKCLCIQY